jgi:DNA repair protein RadA/Sms
MTRAPTSNFSRAIPVTEVKMEQTEIRVMVGISEFDRVLGGGLVTGSLTLIGGDPGVGKSTLLLAAVHGFSTRGVRVLYVSAEESARQVRLRAERLGTLSPNLYLLAETDLDSVVMAIEDVQPRVVVLDSVQTLHRSSLDGVAGSILQVREVAAAAMRISKGRDIATFLVGHVTKEGTLAGPRALEHLVDTVLYLEGDGSTGLRILRANKNRFGSTGEIGLFEMREQGLYEVPDASARLLEERAVGAPGTVVTCSLEGSRPLLVEIQALVGRPTQGNPVRNVVGIDRTRLAMLLAVLGKYGLDLSDRDVFVSAAGGVRVHEPAADLAIAIAIHSSATRRPVPPDLLAFGEVGLVGEVRGVAFPTVRLKEAERHGFKRAIVPASIRDPSQLDLDLCRTLGEVLGAPPRRNQRESRNEEIEVKDF